MTRKLGSPAGGKTPVGRTMEGVTHPRLYRPERFRQSPSIRVQQPTGKPEEEDSSPQQSEDCLVQRQRRFIQNHFPRKNIRPYNIIYYFERCTKK
ncbi:hypothetical protein EVAR_61239_1 [Eumeta japonica]|uniref:Uncharacterized protein n=1 Tax=Eumeta variegata TaxID=151549 RepID=A0A4C1SM07_EUMVA|nr:hypothetical protein EVAR_61239_1 [Eumeta japonica]